MCVMYDCACVGEAQVLAATACGHDSENVELSRPDLLSVAPSSSPLASAIAAVVAVCLFSRLAQYLMYRHRCCVVATHLPTDRKRSSETFKFAIFIIRALCACVCVCACV